MPVYMTPLVNNGISVDEIMTRNFHRRVLEQNLQLEKAVHFEQGNLWEELLRNKQQTSPCQKIIKKRIDDYLILGPQNRPRTEDEKQTKSKCDL